MQVTETAQEGLRHEFKVVIPATTLEDKIGAKVGELARTIRLPGFRPGKVPAKLVRTRFGQAITAEVLEATVKESVESTIKERDLRPALQPEVDVDGFEDGSDLEISLKLEVLPEFEMPDFKAITLDRPVVPVSDDDVAKAMERIAAANTESEPQPEGHVAASGDIAVIDFVGRIDGAPFEGGAAQDHNLELGSGQFLPGFEDQLIGAAVGDEREVTVPFPADYPADHLAGKEAVFAVTMKDLRRPVVPALDDAFAKKLGLDDLEALKSAIRERIEAQYRQAVRMRLKTQLLDKLAETTSTLVPQGMVDMEFAGIWRQVMHAREHGHEDPSDRGKSEEALREEYTAIAERRVRLGLLLADVGRRNGIEVEQSDLNRAMINEARRHPGQEAQVLQFFQSNPRALDQLRAPIYEDKVVDFILELVTYDDQETTAEELMRQAAEDEAASMVGAADDHDHDHDHDHDDDHDHDHDHDHER